jgi:predicted ATPase
MSLNYIQVDGFKNIRNSKLELSKITSLLSVNSYGKSNLLTAIDFGFQFITQVKKDKAKMMSYKRGIPLLTSNYYSNFSLEFSLDFKLGEKKYDVVYGYSFEWSKPNSKGRIITENLKVKEISESHKYTIYIDRNQEGAFYKSSETGRCDKQINIESDELVLNKVLAYDSLFYFDIIKYLNSVSVYIDRHLDSSDSYDPSPVIMKGKDELALDSQRDIPRILFMLKKTYKDKYEIVVNTIKDIFPFVSDIQVKEIKLNQDNLKSSFSEDAPFEISDKIYTLYAEHKNLKSKISFASMSDGVRRVLLLYTFIILAQLNNVLLIGIEEPENSINPGLLRKYLIGLDNFIEDSRVIISSHSPFLINYVNPDNLYLGLPNIEGIATFRKFRQNSLQKLLIRSKENEMMVGEYIFDLMSGSEDDCKELCRYLENE